jgi:hypothetical protein
LLKGDNRTSTISIKKHSAFITNPHMCVHVCTHTHTHTILTAHAHFLSKVSMVDLSLRHRQWSYCGLAFTNMFAFPWEVLAFPFSFVYLKCFVWILPACLEGGRSWKVCASLTKSKRKKSHHLKEHLLLQEER